MPSLRPIRTIQSWRIPPTSVDETSYQSPQIHEGIAAVSNVEISVATVKYLEGDTRTVAPTTTFTLEEENRVIQLLN